MLTQISPVFTLARWSDMIARPTWAPTLRMPGIVRSSAAARDTMRFISGCEMPGAPSQWMRRSRWRNDGSAPFPSAGAIATPARTAAATTTVPIMTHAGRARTANQLMADSYERRSRRRRGDSRRSPGAAVRTRTASAGATVTDTMSDATMATA